MTATFLNRIKRTSLPIISYVPIRKIEELSGSELKLPSDEAKELRHAIAISGFSRSRWTYDYLTKDHPSFTQQEEARRFCFCED